MSNARNLTRYTLKICSKKNEALEQAYERLKAAQAQLVKQERLQRELELAAQVQRNLLRDDLPQFPGLRFAAYLNRPGRWGRFF
ncbi:MAG: hypothetical protein R3D55_21695 [Chloroflexota bacterium]